MIFAVTNRKDCRGDFFDQIKKIAAAKPEQILYRDKLLSENAYVKNAERIHRICQDWGVELVLHTHVGYAAHTHAWVQISLEQLRMLGGRPEGVKGLGVSVHHPDEAGEAEFFGADYLVAGHIFATDCKKGLPPRGTDFLRAVCAKTRLPVYGIGGITEKNCGEVRDAGAAGVCIMSGLMKAEHPEEMIQNIRECWRR